MARRKSDVKKRGRLGFAFCRKPPHGVSDEIICKHKTEFVLSFRKSVDFSVDGYTLLKNKFFLSHGKILLSLLFRFHRHS